MSSRVDLTTLWRNRYFIVNIFHDPYVELTPMWHGLVFHKKSHRACENCGLLFYGSKSKREHASHFRKCTKTKPTCPVCLKDFDYPSYLKKHMLERNHYPK